MSKYHSKKTIVNGITFDSKKEAKRYTELRLLEKSGEISQLTLQKRFELLPSQYLEINGKMRCVERGCSYVADFYYYNIINKQWVVEDVKGMRTDVYRLKKKLMLYFHHIQIKEI